VIGYQCGLLFGGVEAEVDILVVVHQMRLPRILLWNPTHTVNSSGGVGLSTTVEVAVIGCDAGLDEQVGSTAIRFVGIYMPHMIITGILTEWLVDHARVDDSVQKDCLLINLLEVIPTL
jgi:hypothetical protein